MESQPGRAAPNVSFRSLESSRRPILAPRREFLSLPKAALLETAQEPDDLANGLRHRPGRQAEHGPTCRPLGVILPPRAAPAEHQPTPSLPTRSDEPDRPSGRREQLQRTVPTGRSSERQ